MRRLTAALAFAVLSLALAATAMAGKGAGGVTGSRVLRERTALPNRGHADGSVQDRSSGSQL